MSEFDPQAAPNEPLRIATLAALEALRRDAVGGLEGETAAEVAARLLGVLPTETGAQIQLASDGLDLARKLAVEKGLRGALEAAGLRSEGVSIYFRRQTAAADAPATARAGPAPLANRKAPFGLKIDRRAIPGVSAVIVVASGKGGVGKSTVSTNLAVALARSGAKVGLLDADIYGPSAPLMMGLRGTMSIEDGSKLIPKEAYGIKTVSFGFLTDTQQPVIWRGPLVAKALKQLCYEVAWGELDYLIVDLPPGTGDVQLALIESVPIHGAVIVTTPQDVALLDAHKALTMFERLDVRVLGLVENMAFYVCGNCGHADHVFGEGGGERMAKERKLELLGRVPLAAAMRERGDAGRPVALDEGGPLAEPFHVLARRVRDLVP